MMFVSPPEDINQIKILKFYCGVTCLYFPLLTILILCTDLMFQTGKYTFIPMLGLMGSFELIKYIIIASLYKESDKHTNRHGHKGSPNVWKRLLSEKKIKEMVKAVILFCLVTAVYFIIAVLFGAELLSKHEETLMFSTLLSALTVLPPCLHLGPNAALAAILGDDPISSNPLSPVLQSVVRGTLLGSWFGAFVIPLDWDRPWQTWPVPCCVGALMGYVFSHTTCMISIAMRKFLSKNKKLSKNV